jgi:hypothetical protein
MTTHNAATMRRRLKELLRGSRIAASVFFERIILLIGIVSIDAGVAGILINIRPNFVFMAVFKG